MVTAASCFVAPKAPFVLSRPERRRSPPLPIGALPSSVLAADATTTEAVVNTLPSGETFEAIPPDTSTIVAFSSIVVLSVVVVWVWANLVVPVSRTNLAISKKSGAVRGYLDELQQAAAHDGDDEEASGGLLASASNQTLAAMVDETTTKNIDEAMIPQEKKGNPATKKDDRAFERWLFTDWLETKPKKAGRQKEPALPILKDAKWNSGDNPVLVASALISAGVLLSSVTERIAVLAASS